VKGPEVITCLLALHFLTIFPSPLPQSRKTCELRQVRPSVRISAALPARISVTIDIGTCVNIGGKNPNLYKMRKMSGTLHEVLSRVFFSCLRGHKFAVKAQSSTEVVSTVRIAAEVWNRKLYTYCRQVEQSFVSLLMCTTCCVWVNHPEVLKYGTLKPKTHIINIYIYIYIYIYTVIRIQWSYIYICIVIRIKCVCMYIYIYIL